MVRDLLTARVSPLVGIYVHGSAALGGFGPASDLDVLAVADDETDVDWPEVGRALLRDSLHGRPLELSVVTRSAAARPTAPWPYLLHVNSGEDRYVIGDGGDPDLISHYAVVRAAGVPLFGPDPASVVGAVGRGVLLRYLRDELEWGCAEADQRYAVLNACRAVAYGEDGVLLSKLAGGQWMLDRTGPDPLVITAMQSQRDGADQGPCTSSARAFVEESITRLAAVLGSEGTSSP